MHIGFLSFRIAGLDGVSLEADRWKIMLERLGHQVTFIAGDLDRQGLLIPGVHFTEPKIHQIQELVTDQKVKFPRVKQKVFAIAKDLEKEFEELFNKFHFDRLVVANVFSLPVHLSLAIALEKAINDFQIYTISRNHDFWWERKRYHRPSWLNFFQRYFPPPKNPLIAHVTLNNITQKSFKRRTGIDSVIIGDSFDFNDRLSQANHYTEQWRADFDIKPKDIVFLQATRVVPRKQIELSIELVKRLKDPQIILVVAGQTGDEGDEYLGHLKYLVKQTGIRAKFIGDRVGARREIRKKRPIYTLWDCLMNCNLVTYPSRSEGFGNQFIEAIYFRKPIFINRYKVYKTDLEPLGFETIAIDGKITKDTLKGVERILKNSRQRKKMIEKNFRIAKRHFSFETTQKKLAQLGF